MGILIITDDDMPFRYYHFITKVIICFLPTFHANIANGSATIFYPVAAILARDRSLCPPLLWDILS
jgi:hypothetical protein